MSAIEGIPEGYELARVGAPKRNEPYLTPRGQINIAEGDYEGCGYAVLRKIEKPKKYRPFANAAEFEPFRDRWVRYRGDDCGGSRVAFYDNTHARIDDDVDNWNGHFKDYTFDDGSPFGIEVTE